ncbi:MAG TPA: YggT family protein [Candidatus Accumulibacter phosphatis]|nr:MAG: YGGT family protein [Candidatus Accumulibacter sp. SK-11]HAY27186.1 YggT family protein [Accumulibacter sp.]HRL75016.1 YggT family protein [Candidatus Accumulibacter phosphatis]HCN67024.1 YggT family protein [Accumulibacter sp.]HCV13385.1 YggT family protein [Accumulibacter sp.]
MIAAAGLFLLDALASFLTVALLLRFFMQACRVSFNNQLGTFVVALSNWLVRPLRRLLPGFYGLDLASLLPAYLLQVVYASAVFIVRGGIDSAVVGVWLPLVFWYGLLATLRLTIYLLIAALLIQAVLSWISPYSPLGQPVSQLTRPVLRPIQRFVPTIGGVDLAPLIAIVFAQLLLMFL